MLSSVMDTYAYVARINFFLKKREGRAELRGESEGRENEQRGERKAERNFQGDEKSVCEEAFRKGRRADEFESI
jgi:hypothetical protein